MPALTIVASRPPVPTLSNGGPRLCNRFASRSGLGVAASCLCERLEHNSLAVAADRRNRLNVLPTCLFDVFVLFPMALYFVLRAKE